MFDATFTMDGFEFSISATWQPEEPGAGLRAGWDEVMIEQIRLADPAAVMEYTSQQLVSWDELRPFAGDSLIAGPLYDKLVAHYEDDDDWRDAAHYELNESN